MTRSTNTATPGRVVIRPPNWLGDAVLALPAMAAVRRHFAASHVTIAATPAVAALFREDTSAQPDRVLDLPVGTRDAVALLEGGGFDLGVLFPNSFRSAWQFHRAGIRQRWGYPTSGRGLLLTRRARKTRPSGVRHQSDYYRDLVRGLEVDCEPSDAPVVAPKPPSVERANALLTQVGIAAGESFVCLAPGAAYGSAKQWPPDRMAELAARLVRTRGLMCVLIGASHDRDAARAIESWLRSNARDASDRVVNLVGRTSLGALIGVTARSAAFVSNDSGAMHLAAALARPVIAIFGPTDERATHPVGDHTVIAEPVFCRPCMLRDCPIDHRCMKRISTDRVYAAIEAHLGGTAAT
jgi:heptosyltransferase II